MTFHISSNIFVPTAESYAKSALATLPYARRTCGYWAHGLQVSSLRLVKFKTAYGVTVVKLNMYIESAMVEVKFLQDGMDDSLFRQTFELGAFISIAGKSILNLVKW